MKMSNTTINSPIVIDPEYAESKVYFDFVNKRHEHVYLVKISFTDAELFINSITVQPNPKQPGKLWVQLPRYFKSGSWVWPLQMKNGSNLRKLVDDLAVKAVNDYTFGKDEVYIPTDEELDNINEFVGKGIDEYLENNPP